VAGRAVPRQEMGPLKPTVKGSGTPEPAASSEADFGRMSLGDVSAPLCGMPHGNTPDTPMETTTVIPAVERQESCPSGPTAQMTASLTAK
jgi:hypothetical protein